jgi:DNA-binding NarL/FixJ family response regulator
MPVPGPIRILIVDDHPIVRDGLGLLLGTDPGFHLVGSVDGAEKALAFIRRRPVDLVLLDLRMPRVSGREVLPSILASQRAPKVIVLSSFNFDEEIYQAARAGAHGYITKDASGAQILEAVRSVFAGNLYFPQGIAAQLTERQERSGLSPRELQVLDMIARGLTNKEIAQVLMISQFTVRTHVVHIFEKLAVSDRTEAVAIASQQGIINFNPS